MRATRKKMIGLFIPLSCSSNKTIVGKHVHVSLSDSVRMYDSVQHISRDACIHI